MSAARERCSSWPARDRFLPAAAMCDISPQCEPAANCLLSAARLRRGREALQVVVVVVAAEGVHSPVSRFYPDSTPGDPLPALTHSLHSAKVTTAGKNSALRKERGGWTASRPAAAARLASSLRDRAANMARWIDGVGVVALPARRHARHPPGGAARGASEPARRRSAAA